VYALGPSWLTGGMNCGGGETHLLRRNIQFEREEMPTNGVLSLLKEIMHKPNAMKLCV
jgi:hypothetical protein